MAGILDLYGIKTNQCYHMVMVGGVVTIDCRGRIGYIGVRNNICNRQEKGIDSAIFN